MTEENQTNEPTPEELAQQAAFDNLKLKADRLGVKYKSNTTFASLQAKVSKVMKEVSKEVDAEPVDKNESVAMEQRKPTRETAADRDARMRKDNRLLYRVRITCHNPSKAKWDGEMISGGNRLGQEKKMVKFGVPFHVPQIILNVLEERKFQQHVTRKDPRTGREIHSQRLANEFAIEHLPPLTPKELKDLAHEQKIEMGFVE